MGKVVLMRITYPPTEFQKEILRSLMVDCKRLFESPETTSPVSWGDFFRCRGVDYRGEEILTAQSMQWENVRGALPDEVGGVNLEDVVERGSRHYVLHFENYLDRKSVV